MHSPSRSPLRPLRAAGFTLIELMVAMVVSLVLVLALMTMTTNFERSKRQTQGNSVMGQNVGYISYDFDRQLRSAGSGFLSNAIDPNGSGADLTAYRRTLGCTLNVSLSGNRILPMQSAISTQPFSAVPLNVPLIPVLIYAGVGVGGGDVLAIMAGSSGIGETPIGIKPLGAGANQLELASSVGLKANDLLLVVETNRPCMLTQVASNYVSGPTNTAVALGGDYYAATSGTASLTGYATGTGVSSVLLFGNTNNMPQLRLYGVGANHQLLGLDLLRAQNGGAAYTAAENVQDLRALYGVDDNFDGVIDRWVPPTDTNFTATALSDHSAASQQRLLSIRAVRIGLLVHSDRIEKDAVSPTSVTMFSDLGPTLTRTISLSGTDRQRHYRVVDFTIPLRNAVPPTFPVTVPTTQVAP